MLEIRVPANELWNSRTEEFYSVKETVLKLEHSLVSISKWEANWQKPFLGSDSRTRAETLDYVKCMTLTQNVDPMVFSALSMENLRVIEQYINTERTATKIHRGEGSGGVNTQPTSERIYGWMIEFGIPFDPCQKWHLSRLLALIRICNAQATPGQKMSPREQAEFNRALNQKRRAALHSRG